jgi:hypothetical protein
MRLPQLDKNVLSSPAENEVGVLKRGQHSVDQPLIEGGHDIRLIAIGSINNLGADEELLSSYCPEVPPE